MPPVTRVQCPGCHSPLRIPAERLDQPLRCPRCARTFRLKMRPKAETADTAEAVQPESAPAPANGMVPAAPPADVPAALPANEFDLGLDAGLSPVSVVNKYRRTAAGPKSSKVRGAVAFAALVAVAAVGGYYYQEIVERYQAFFGSIAGRADEPVPVSPSTDPVRPKPTPVVPNAEFPRRLLVISVNNYLYANPVNSGGTLRGMQEIVKRLREKLRIPADHAYLLSDGLPAPEARPTLKPVIQRTVETFLATSRPQDRLLIVFVGRAVDVENVAYLVPLEGELTEKETLIPLQWLYDRLAACPARQKVLVMDVCRADTARGEERPGGGPMGPKLDEMLRNPPAGVQVWSACSAGEFSYEYDRAEFNDARVEGGVFLSMWMDAFRAGVRVAKPEDSLPMDVLAGAVHPKVTAMVKAREQAAQTPRLTGQEAGPGAAPNADEPRPHFELPKPAQLSGAETAPATDVEAVFREIAVPALKRPREQDRQGESPEQQATQLAAIVPFRADVLRAYATDYRQISEIRDKAGQYPLRLAVLQTVEALDRQGRLSRVRIGSKEEVGERPIEEIRGGTTETLKKRLTQSQRAGPAMMLVELSELHETLEKAGEARAKEPSKRWQAHYDYVLAQLKSRTAFVHEYNAMLGKVKRDELPALDAKLHNGWRLSSQEKLQSPKEVKDLAADAKKLFAKIIKDHPGTPWEVLAKRERHTALGLAWQPASLGE